MGRHLYSDSYVQEPSIPETYIFKGYFFKYQTPKTWTNFHRFFKNICRNQMQTILDFLKIYLRGIDDSNEDF